MSRRLRRTKIVTTLGPATDRDNNLEKVIAAGANEAGATESMFTQHQSCISQRSITCPEGFAEPKSLLP